MRRAGPGRCRGWPRCTASCTRPMNPAMSDMFTGGYSSASWCATSIGTGQAHFALRAEDIDAFDRRVAAARWHSAPYAQDAAVSSNRGSPHGSRRTRRAQNAGSAADVPSRLDGAGYCHAVAPRRRRGWASRRGTGSLPTPAHARAISRSACVAASMALSSGGPVSCRGSPRSTRPRILSVVQGLRGPVGAPGTGPDRAERKRSETHPSKAAALAARAQWPRRSARWR